MSRPEDQPPGHLQAGTRLARHYLVDELIGIGGMAEVYRGRHEAAGRPVAIKVLKAALCNSTVAVRFLLEARASSRVRHDNVVDVTDFGEMEDGRPFMIMEYLEGEDLASTLKAHGGLPWDRVRLILLQVLAALEAAHERGIVHRDIKPGNVFRMSHGGSPDFVKVLDFGIAKILLGDGRPVRPLTTEGDLLGTPTYMAPEQCTGSDVDARADVYSAGIIAFEMLTGRPPFLPCSSAAILIYNQLNTPVPVMHDLVPELTLPEGVEEVIRRALEKERDDRWESAKEFAQAVLASEGDDSSSLMPGLQSLFSS